MNINLIKEAFGKNSGKLYGNANGLTRRAFVERCALAAFGLAVLPVAGSLGADADLSIKSSTVTRGAGFGKAKRIIMINLQGGLSHIDSFDPKTGETKGPGKTIDTKAGFQMTEYFSEIAKIASEITVIRSMTAKVGVHEQAQYLMRTGFEKRGTICHPILGAWAQNYLGPSHKTLPSSVTVNRGSEHGNGFFPANFSPLPVFDPNQGLTNIASTDSEKSQSSRLELMGYLDRSFAAQVPGDIVHDYGTFYDETLRLMKGEDLKAFDLSQEKTELRDAYGRNKLGQGCLLARRLTEHGVRFVEVNSGGWDMHQNLADSMKKTGADFDKGFAALINDLKQRNLLDTTLVAVVSEFGRKPQMDGTGRGHHPAAFASVLAGAGVKKGFVYGVTDEKGYAVTENPVGVGELHATIAYGAGLPLEKEVKTPEGRPMVIGNKAKPVVALFA